MSKITTLANLIAAAYTTDEPKFFVFCERGSGAPYRLKGLTRNYDDIAAARYGAIIMHPTLPHMSSDHVACCYASEWIADGDGCSYRVRF